MEEVDKGEKPLSLYEINLVQEVDQNEKNFTQEMWLLKKQESTKEFDFFHEHR